jgi:pilus assembly protein FimV
MEPYFSVVVALLVGIVAYIFMRKRPPPREVDPIAEADVYVAYGRTRQAIETLEVALKTNPQQPNVVAKLAEIKASKQ